MPLVKSSKKLLQRELPLSISMRIDGVLAWRQKRAEVMKKGALRAFRAANSEVERTTNAVGALLTDEIKTNARLRGLVYNFPYLIIDRHGNLSAAMRNVNRLSMGFYRLERKKILEGYYKRHFQEFAMPR